MVPAMVKVRLVTVGGGWSEQAMEVVIDKVSAERYICSVDRIIGIDR